MTILGKIGVFVVLAFSLVLCALISFDYAARVNYHAALTELKKLDERKCQAVELRYFGGLVTEEIAETLGISATTVRRDLRMAEAWLNREMSRLT